VAQVTQEQLTVLRLEKLSKTFPGQTALIDVDLTVASGEVHALVGQNGSGKSTLIKVLAGYHQPDPGASAWVNGVPLPLGNGAMAAAAGIRFVHQDLGLVQDLNTIENLALVNGYETGPGGRILWRNEAKRTSDAMSALGFSDFDIKAPVSTLAPSQRTAVAIARALVGWETGSDRAVNGGIEVEPEGQRPIRPGASLLVLDEPTASLAADDKSRLFEVVKTLKARGVSILYVSHHLDEVFELADSVTVLRDARKVTTVPVKSLNHDGLIELIVGRRVELGTVSGAATMGEPIVTVARLAGGSVEHLDLEIRPGEIVGVAGIMGSGREHVVGLLCGQMPQSDGVVTVAGAHIPSYSPAIAKQRGVANVPSDRSVRGAISAFSVRENMTVSDVNRFVLGGRLRRKAELLETQSWIEALRMSPKLLLLDEPTQGVDVGAKDQIHSLVDAAAADGAATLVASTDTDELVRLCHRVLVLVEGRVVAQLTGADITAETIEQLQLQTSQRIA
jgi:ribose transport system ATP-binding protein